MIQEDNETNNDKGRIILKEKRPKIKRETEGGKYTRERKIPINKREEKPQ